MSEDASVNIDAVAWPEPDVAYFAVRKMQIKLHRWAGDDSSRRFGDLFNLVSDPAFLMHAWQCVSSNAGARSPGIDKVTVAWIESWIQDSGHSALVVVRSGPGFDLVAQGEVGAWVEGVCGGEVLAQLGDGGGGAQGW